MVSPFDEKNKFASRVDHFTLCTLVLLGCVAYFFSLWHSLRESVLAGLALFILLMITYALFERSTLTTRSRALRERIGGTIALHDLVLMPNREACRQICTTLCTALGAKAQSSDTMHYCGETWLIRCAQCMKGSSASDGDVLAAHRARMEQEVMQCVLCSTGGFSPSAIRTAEWVDPPIRLISGAQLAALFGRLSPATDEDIARHARRQRQPFSLARMRALALSPAKQRKYLLCSFLLLVFYLITAARMCLVSCLLAFLLSMLCQKENSRVFRL